MPELTFRNITATPSDPVDTWGFEGLLTAVDRGQLPHWRRIAEAMSEDPWGPVAHRLDEVAAVANDRGAVALLLGARERARQRAEHEERAIVAAELRDLVSSTGLTTSEFAARIGTSRTRLSSWLNGHVAPRSTMLVRARRLGQSHTNTGG